MLDTEPAMASREEPAGFVFGRFVLLRRQRLLLMDGERVEFGSRAFEVLLMLAEAAGALLTKNAILDRVWPDTSVGENNLQAQVSALRRALGPDRDWIMTIPGRGYRFTAPVAPLAGEEVVPLSRPAEEAEPPRLSLMVLPFASRGDDPAQDWFADAITDSLSTDLARALPGSSVTAQTTAQSYKGRPADVRAVGREHGVRYVVEGSLLLAEDCVRVNVQIVEVETGAQLWAERFDKTRGDVLQVQDEIVGRLTRWIGLNMIDSEARRAERAEDERPGGGTAEDFVLRGRASAGQPIMTRDSAEAAYALYASALERDPGNADALAGIGTQRVYQVLNGYLGAGEPARGETVAREAYLAEAEETLSRALSASPDHLAALKARAVLLRARGAFPDALAAAEAILVRNPGDPIVIREIGLNLLYLGRAEEAVVWFRRADELAPADPARWTWLQGLGRALVHVGRDAEAVDALRLAVASNPAYPLSHALLAAALALTGEHGQARMVIEAFRSAEPATSMDELTWRSAVPLEATDPLYRSRNTRLLNGLRCASQA